MRAGNSWTRIKTKKNRNPFLIVQAKCLPRNGCRAPAAELAIIRG